MSYVVEASGLSKSYGKFKALKNVNVNIERGKIVGVVGANGAGKSTMLNAILGLSKYEGSLKVLGQDPSTDRASLMENVSFISDVATLPRWMKVYQVLDFVEGVHNNFDRDLALSYLAKTKIPLDKKIKGLSKGMVTQLHLAVVMAIKADLLVLDEPTLGLDILFRKRFYESVLEDYFDHDRTILITTHQVEEVESILTDALFIKDGEMVLYNTMEEIEQEFAMVTVENDMKEKAEALNPIYSSGMMGMTSYVFDKANEKDLAGLGKVKKVGLADLFVAIMSGDEE